MRIEDEDVIDAAVSASISLLVKLSELAGGIRDKADTADGWVGSDDQETRTCLANIAADGADVATWLGTASSLLASLHGARWFLDCGEEHLLLAALALTSQDTTLAPTLESVPFSSLQRTLRNLAGLVKVPGSGTFNECCSKAAARLIRNYGEFAGQPAELIELTVTNSSDLAQARALLAQLRQTESV